MPEGTPVQAARDGFILDQETNIVGHGLTESDATKANHIKIVHSDGTFAIYAHLQNQGSVVKIGQKVKSSQLIGYSGNTGYSSGPHLHFEVAIPGIHSPNSSVPVAFYTSSGSVSPLLEKHSYTSICGIKMNKEEERQTAYRQKIGKTLEVYSPLAFENCYAPYLREFRKNQGPAPKQGQLEFNVEIASNGSVKNVTTVENHELPKEIETCVKNGVYDLNFGSSNIKAITIPYAVTFSFQ